MERIGIAFKAEWYGELEGWTVSYIHKNLWKHLPHYDFDDLYQEAYICFLYVRDLYSGPKYNAKHFMCLYKLAVSQRFIDLGEYRRRRMFESNFTSLQRAGDDEFNFEEVMGVDTHFEAEASLKLLAEGAPPLFKRVLRAFLEDPDCFPARHAKVDARYDSTEEKQRLACVAEECSTLGSEVKQENYLSFFFPSEEAARSFISQTKKRASVQLEAVNTMLCRLARLSTTDYNMENALRIWLGDVLCIGL